MGSRPEVESAASELCRAAVLVKNAISKLEAKAEKSEESKQALDSIFAIKDLKRIIELAKVIEALDFCHDL